MDSCVTKNINLEMRYSLCLLYIIVDNFIVSEGFAVLVRIPIYVTLLKEEIARRRAAIDNDRGKEKASDLLRNKMVAIS